MTRAAIGAGASVAAFFGTGKVKAIRKSVYLPISM